MKWLTIFFFSISLVHPFQGQKDYIFQPTKILNIPWIVLQGIVDQVLNSDSTFELVNKTSNVKTVPLKMVSHEFSVQANWIPLFKEAFTQIAERSDDIHEISDISLTDLPIVELPPSGIIKDYLALLLTGDGGYGETDKGIANGLAENGIQTVVLNSLHYFWKKRTPQETAKDIERILQYYLSTSKNDKIVLIGYSFGADVLPFVFNLLPKTLQDKVELITFIGLGKNASFKFHLTNWVGLSSSDDDLPIRPELEKLRGKRMLCFYGKNDKDDLCPELDANLAKQIMLPGGHRLGKNFLPVVKAILGEVQ